MTNIDLHIHSNISDGTLSGKQIIDEAVKNNVKTISITDHDIIDVYTNDFFKYAKKNSIKIIPGVEISTKLNKVSIHILGYNIDLNNQLLKEQLKILRESRIIYLKEVTEKLKEFDLIVNENELKKLKTITKAHIAIDVVNNKLNEKALKKLYSYIPNKDEFIETMLNKGCKAFILRNTLTPKQASDLIKQASGKVVIAHPIVYNIKDKLTKEEIKNIIKDIKADGIESNYIYVKDETIHNKIDTWNNIANELKLMKTIGSDYHNSNDKHPLIGFENYNLEFDYNIKDLKIL